MQDNMHLSGQLSDWSINDLLHIMEVTGRTGSLDIDGERRGRVHFRDGRVTGAELTGTKGSYLGTDQNSVADVLYVLSTMDSGTFAVGAADGPEAKGWAVEEILTEIEALRSLEGEVVDAGLFEAAGVRLVGQVEDPVTIEPEDWHVLVALVPAFTFSHLESQFGRGTAVRIFHTLHRLGVADVLASKEEEPGWLDQIAVGISTPTEMPTEADPAKPEPEEVSSDEKTSEVGSGEKEGERRQTEVTGVAAPASTILTEGVYDEIRRLRNRVRDR